MSCHNDRNQICPWDIPVMDRTPDCPPPPKPEHKASAQFVSGINLMPPSVGQEIIGFWPTGNVQAVDIGVTAVADREKIKLSGSKTIILQPGRYIVDTHVLVGNFDYLDPQGSDPIITKLFLNGIPLDYTTNSIDVLGQLFVVTSSQLNKSNIINVTQPDSTLQWMAGNTVSRDFHFDLYEASITVVEI
ncbi:MAG: hypothetical protein RSF82_10270 [Angelakisella sp.]